MKSIKLSDIIEVKSRFGRSVNLERDFYSESALNGYVLTSTALNGLSRVIEASRDSSNVRSWTLTGPFGTGKSTFALFLARTFHFEREQSSLVGEEILFDKTDTRLQGLLSDTGNNPRFFPILVSGSREPLGSAFLRALRSALKNRREKEFQRILREVEDIESSPPVEGVVIIQLIQEVSRALNKLQSSPISILIVIDELGKLLEFAALNPGKSDIFLLQQLAEISKSTESPLFLLTILHREFNQYAHNLQKDKRDEWLKIQGRFEDIPFQEPNEQMLLILKNVFVHNEKAPQYPIIQKTAHELARKAFDLGLTGFLPKDEAIDALSRCSPLHPTVALTLGPLFRRFGQNERSLFAFLTSSEPYGALEFLRNTIWDKSNRQLIRLHNVYDYLVSALGSSLTLGVEGRKWAEVESALTRLVEVSELEVQLVKTVGLLYVMGDVGKLKSSREILHFALSDNSVSTEQIDQALIQLLQRSVVTERLFNNTFVIWEGSDVNLEERFAEAERHIDVNLPLAENLTHYFRPAPLVAKRHSYRTGTLRYFDISYVDHDFTIVQTTTSVSAADGRIVFLLANNDREAEELSSLARKKTLEVGAQTILAIPKNLTGLRDAVRQTLCWQWVRANTPELENDRAARNELTARLGYSEQIVLNWLENWYSNTTESGCSWFWRNEERVIDSPRGVQEFISQVCDEIFSYAPILKNELINRKVLSAAGSAARRCLFEAMISNGDKPQLGITGYPPQLSMYFSLLERTTLHRKENGRLGFFPPTRDANSGIQEVWRRIERFLEQTEVQRLPLTELFKVLEAPPYGLRSGVVPILFAVVLISYESEIALYENGNFVPKLSLPVFERICRAPADFSVQQCKIEGARTHLLDKVAELLLPGKQRRVDILTLVRPLARFAQELEEYTRYTSRLSANALNIRRALFSAREPDKLLFKLLPEACGFEEFRPEGGNDQDDAEEFTRRLKNGLAELKRAYAELLDEIESMLIQAFSLSPKRARDQIQQRAHFISDFAVSPKLKGFILRITDAHSDRKQWLESVGALLAGKPPSTWRDDDLSRFEIGLSEMVRSFINLESLVFEKVRTNLTDTDVELIRLGLTQMSSDEVGRVLPIRAEDQATLKETEELLLAAFDRSSINGNLNLRLAALAKVALRLIKESQQS